MQKLHMHYLCTKQSMIANRRIDNALFFAEVIFSYTLKSQTRCALDVLLLFLNVLLITKLISYDSLSIDSELLSTLLK